MTNGFIQVRQFEVLHVSQLSNILLQGTQSVLSLFYINPSEHKHKLSK